MFKTFCLSGFAILMFQQDLFDDDCLKFINISKRHRETAGDD
jgi:hypothetical protein